MAVSLYLLFEVLAAVFCLHYLYGEKVRAERTTVGFIIIELFIMHVIYFLHLGQGWTLIIYPIICIYCGMKFEFNFKSIFVNVILYILLVGGIQITIMSLFNTFFRPDYINEYVSLIMNVIVFLIVIGVFRKLNLKKVSLLLQRKEKIVHISALIAIAGMALCLCFYKNKQGFSFAYYIIFLLCIVLIGIVLVDIGLHKVKAKEMEAELRLHKLYEKSFQNLIEDISARQHEFDNHINTIYSQHFLYTTYEELVEAQKKYCKAVVNANTYNKLLSKGNPIVLGFLYGKFTEAEKMGINLEYKIKIGEMDCSIPIYKLIEILGNLINNACEALMKQELKKLKVVMIENKFEIAIDIGNECRDIDYEDIPQFFKKGYSDKGKNRGYGLYNVKKICDEYNIIVEAAIKKEEIVDMLHFTLIISKPIS